MVKTIRELKKENKKLLREFKKMCNDEMKLKNDIEMGKEGSKRMSSRTLKAKETKRKTLNSKINTMRKKLWKIQDAIAKK